jgi:hypothetical protein
MTKRESPSLFGERPWTIRASMNGFLHNACSHATTSWEEKEAAASMLSELGKGADRQRQTFTPGLTPHLRPDLV